MKLSSRDIDGIARAVAAALEPLLKTAGPSEDAVLLDTGEAARRLGVSKGYVYAHADKLGAMRLGSGPKPRLRFHPQSIDLAVAGRHGPLEMNGQREDLLPIRVA